MQDIKFGPKILGVNLSIIERVWAAGAFGIALKQEAAIG